MSRLTRMVALDIARLFAAFQMIQGHTIDAVLVPAARSGALHGAWQWMRGATSIIFLFVAGASLSLAQRKTVRLEPTEAAADVRRRLLRAAWLVALGYLLRIPAGALLAHDYVAAWRQITSVDVLQCIGVMLFLMELPMLASLRWRPYLRMLIGFVFGFVLPAVLLRHRITTNDSWTRLPLSYFGGDSRFPLITHGAVVVHGFLWHRVLSDWLAARMGRFKRVTGLVSFTVFFVIQTVLVFGPDHTFQMKFMFVAAALTVLALALRQSPPLPRVLNELAGQTLVLYVFHIVLVYADFVGLSARFGHSLSAWPAIALALCVIAASAVVALAWHRWRAGGKIGEHA